MWEEGNLIKVAVDLPGFSKDQVKVEARDGKLLVWGEKKDVVDRPWHHHERHSKIRRSINLPFTADQSKVDAKFLDGVLQIDIKKLEGAAPGAKMIQIK